MTSVHDVTSDDPRLTLIRSRRWFPIKFNALPTESPTLSHSSNYTLFIPIQSGFSSCYKSTIYALNCLQDFRCSTALNIDKMIIYHTLLEITFFLISFIIIKNSKMILLFSPFVFYSCENVKKKTETLHGNNVYMLKVIRNSLCASELRASVFCPGLNI